MIIHFIVKIKRNSIKYFGRYAQWIAFTNKTYANQTIITILNVIQTLILTSLRIFWRYGVPIRSAMCLYAGWERKKFLSAISAALMSFFPSISFWLLLTIPMYPNSHEIIKWKLSRFFIMCFRDNIYSCDIVISRSRPIFILQLTFPNI